MDGKGKKHGGSQDVHAYAQQTPKASLQKPEQASCWVCSWRALRALDENRTNQTMLDPFLSHWILQRFGLILT